MNSRPTTWQIIAANLPEHARNPIHTDDGAQAAGFPRALVAGVTTYAYLTHPLIVAWGRDWLQYGGGEVRFRRPVFDGDLLRCSPIADGDEIAIHAVTDEPEQPRVIFQTQRQSVPLIALRIGEKLPDITIALNGEWGCDYGNRAGDDLSFYTDENLVHPAVWPALANQVVYQHVARGSWIHTRSIIRHHGVAHGGDIATMKSVVVRRFESHGERAILDVHIEVAGKVVASLEHEAIVALPDSTD